MTLSQRKQRWMRRGMATLGALVVVVGGVLWLLACASLPIEEGERRVKNLGQPVTIQSDRYGIPTILAHSRTDAFRALGYVTARDRLFQMDIARRAASGRLSQIFGSASLQNDQGQRVLGFSGVARAVVSSLPADQREVLQAYAEGVNALLGDLRALPVEFLLLGYQPEQWKPEDSVLCMLNMFQMLAGDEETERMLTVMETALPPEVVTFLTSDTDPYATLLLGGDGPRRPVRSIPREALQSVSRIRALTDPATIMSGQKHNLLRGSNAWAVSGRKTVDGRALVANDMHLGLSLPNTWYRVALRYDTVALVGVVSPGIPVLIAGSNGHVAWGFTNVLPDVLDLVRIETDRDHQEEYKTPEGWKRLTVEQERIPVNGSHDVVIQVSRTIWGPVSPRRLMNHLVAVHWTALDPAAVDIGLINMDRVLTLEEGIAVINRFGGPPLNAVLADDQGHIGWTLAGRIPIRDGLDGTISQSWAAGARKWAGYVPPDQLPRLVNPPSGIIAVTNNRTVGEGYPYVIGHNFLNGYRASRIKERLSELDRVTESDMLTLQLDTESKFYEFYRQLALDVLSEETRRQHPLLAQAYPYVKSWDGHAAINSVGFSILTRFHEMLQKKVLQPLWAHCKKIDAGFLYVWINVEPPLRLLLTERPPQGLDHDVSWEALVVSALEESLLQLMREHHARSIGELTWGQLNKAHIVNLVFDSLPLFGRLFDSPADPLAGCGYCVQVAAPDFGASERMVVSPGHQQDGIFHMPGGQSGHPLSAHYMDQHRAWVLGEALPFLPGAVVHSLTLKPQGVS